MRIDVLSAVPFVMESYLKHSILAKAQEKGVVTIKVHDLRDFATDKHRQIDDYPYGGGGGMVLKPEPIGNAIESLSKERTYDEIIYLTPDGEVFNQAIANALSLKKNLLFLAGHYKGVDERVRQLYITKELSIGDYVLTGGELAALVVIDAIVRLIPGAVGDSSAILEDSFQDGLLAPPVYTRPVVYKGLEVPEVLRSGNAKAIQEWRLKMALEKTRKRRPDLFKRYLQR